MIIYHLDPSVTAHYSQQQPYLPIFFALNNLFFVQKIKSKQCQFDHHGGQVLSRTVRSSHRKTNVIYIVKWNIIRVTLVTKKRHLNRCTISFQNAKDENKYQSINQLEHPSFLCCLHIVILPVFKSVNPCTVKMVRNIIVISIYYIP